MRQRLIINLLTVLSAIVIYLPDEVSSFKRCPEYGLTDFPVTNTYPDEKFCNVYHKCNCTRTECQAVQSHVCPIAKVYSKAKETCLDIEEESCETTYIQWVQTHSSNPDTTAILISDSLLPSTSSKDFECKPSEPGKYSDPNICNIFHVCINRNDKTVDQPFMCPFPTVFKKSSSGKMSCAYPDGNDCKGKAFYRSMEGLSRMITENNDGNNYRLPENTLMSEKCTQSGPYPDKIYCNAYHKCTNKGEDEQYLCENQLLFNPESNICDYPINVDCGEKGIYRRSSNDTNKNLKFNQESDKKVPLGKSFQPKSSNFILLQPPIQNQKVVLNVPFDCKGRIDGHWRDTRYCDVFHACIAGEQKRSYGCTQIGERFYFDDASQKCEFASKNSGGCQSNQYHTQIEAVPAVSGSQLSTEAPTEPWKIFIHSREQFSCSGKQDGFYASRWCNLFYRCYTGIATSFLCPKMSNGARLWWVQHGSPQSIAQETAACTWPCETGRRCSSSGGIIVDSGSTVSESQQEAETVFSQSVCTTSSSGNVNPGTSSGGSNSGSFVPQPPSTGGSSSGTFVPQPPASGGSSSGTFVPQPPASGGSSSGTFVPQPPASGGSSGSISGTTGGSSATPDGTFTVSSDVSCAGQRDGVFLGSQYCNVFHRCVSGTRRDFRCPRATNTPYDLWWNQQTQQCDWPCRIQCSGSVYGTASSAQQIRTENALLFSNECAGYQTNLNTGLLNNQAIVYSSASREPESTRSLTSRIIENPDPNYLCIQTGKHPTQRYCNVYYECSEIGLPPTQTFECIDGFFDRNQGTCMSKDQVPCLGGIYPYDSIPIDENPDSLQCSINSGFQLHISKQFCNIYYLCDGTQTTPTTFRCFDRQTQEEGIYDPFAERCDSRRNSNCQNGILNLSNIQYRSLLIDHTRLNELSTLPCQYDQSYVIEHEQYCNLYHVCKQGNYYLYACLSNDQVNQPVSYFYQPNGQCAAPLTTLCPRTKTIFSYQRLLSPDTSEMFQPYVMAEQQQQQSQQYNFGSIPIQERVEPIPKCRITDNYIIPHERYCNLFYGCKEGELILYACVDRSTNNYGGVFQSSTGNCIGTNECPTNEFFRPNQVTTLRPNENALFRSYTMLETSNDTLKINETFQVQSPFSCVNHADGYYESEWCNIFYRCVSGKRYDERCPLAGSQSLSNYDLWWRHQYPTYNATNPQYFAGLDHMVQCEWPCKIQCKKPVWLSKSNVYGKSDLVLKQDQHQRPSCSAAVNKKIEHSMQLPQQMIMYSDIPNPSNYTCPTNIQGARIRMPDSKYCNVFHECTNSKLVGSFLCIESQYDSNENDCMPLTINKNCPLERRYSYARTRLSSQSALTAYYEAVEVRSINPSGYECITDGIHTDPMFCNLFHACSGRTRRTFQCRQTGTDGINDGVSTFDLNTKSCTRFSSYSCSTLLYNQEFTILPVMFKPPNVSPCGKEGFFPVSDLTAQYCNMFAWCAKGHGEATVFECVPSITGAHTGAFDISRRSCTSRVTCPNARHSSAFNTSFLALTLKPKIISINKRKQFSLTSTMLENGYIALGSDFQTSFTCPLGTGGFFSNPTYCDVFHYCYESGELSSFVCASMPNRYQLWWSHHNEQGRADNVYCDWPCNLQGVYACPAHKSVLMRDRQPFGNIPQREVIQTTCTSAQVPVPAKSADGNNITPDPMEFFTPTFYPSPVPNMNNNNNNNILPQPQTLSVSSSVLGYKPCIPTNDWYASQPTMRCSASFTATGYAPDPRDCSKYYACDAYIGPDGMSAGILMQCLAGLWWDQQRRACVLPSEVACNPYNIINSQGQNAITEKDRNMMYQSIPPSAFPFSPMGTTPMVVFPQPSPQPQPPVQHAPPSGPGGPTCRGMPTCMDIGLNILQQMKGIPGRAGWFYKCDSQCAIEMRCPPGLVFDDVYQRCEWPGAGSQSPRYRLGSLRNKKDGKKQIQFASTMQQKQPNSTVSSLNKMN